jgi:very-short-patch-repair endonuclease
MKPNNTSNFVNNAKIIHKNKYDYSLCEYKNANTKVKIICPEHGIFEQIPYKHLKKQGCPKCSGKNKSTTSEFIKKAKEIHKDIYDYSLVDYINCDTKVKMICPEHGIFQQTPSSHLSKSGCPKCSGKIKSTTSEFIKKAKEIHKDIYDYSLVDYINCDTKVKIICPEHGIFQQTPEKHLKKQGCPICCDNKKMTNMDFIKKAKKIHKNKYDYSLVNYINNHTNVKIICHKHGEFEQAPTNHLKGEDCPNCKIKSKGEIEIKNILDYLKIEYIQQKKFKDCKNILSLPFDFYLPKHNILIEFDGRQHFNINTKYYTPQITKNDNIKNNYCIKNSITLLRIKFDEDIKEKIKTIC